MEEWKQFELSTVARRQPVALQVVGARGHDDPFPDPGGGRRRIGPVCRNAHLDPEFVPAALEAVGPLPEVKLDVVEIPHDRRRRGHLSHASVV